MMLKRQGIESGNSGSLFIILFLEREMLLELKKRGGGEREAKGRISSSHQSKHLAKSRIQKSMQSNSHDPNPHRIYRQLKDYKEEQNVCSVQIEN